MKSTKDRVIQTSRDAHTREDAPQATSDSLEASFKSNKRESNDEDASSSLEMNLAALSLERLSLTPQSFSHSRPSSNQLNTSIFLSLKT
jgi:gamma-glutamyl phosphate reductase